MIKLTLSHFDETKEAEALALYQLAKETGWHTVSIKYEEEEDYEDN